MTKKNNIVVTDNDFQFLHEDGTELYTYHADTGHITWQFENSARDTGKNTTFAKETVQRLVRNGTWVIQQPQEVEVEEVETYIVSNQIRCKSCGDEPYSMHVHHFVSCDCGAVSVDGGQEYLKRTGDLSGYEEMSVTIDKAAMFKLTNYAEQSLNTNRNPLGVTLAILRGIRDQKLVSEVSVSGITRWTQCV